MSAGPRSEQDARPLQDRIVDFLRGRTDGAASSEIAEKFLRLRNPSLRAAEAAAAAVLGRDRRCLCGGDGVWRAAAPEKSGRGLRDLPWAAAFCIPGPGRGRPLYLSIWEIHPSPALAASGWLEDPETLEIDEREALASAADAPFSPDGAAGLLSALAGEKRIPVFLSSADRSLLSVACAFRGISIADDTALAGGLLRAAGLTARRPLTLDALETAVLGAPQSGASARKLGERFADALFELFCALSANGVESRDQLDAAACTDKSALFSGKEFSFETLLGLPSRPGVYGFRDRAGAWLYVGKALDLKRRLLSYFSDTDESPEKIGRLRAEAHSLVTHVCGSELESLIYEHRLIRKYSPPLNRQREVLERKGAFRPVDDCIVLLRHAEPGKGMSVWFRRDRKILLRPFSAGFEPDPALTKEIDGFFFSPSIPPSSTDFPELEIASRWIKGRSEGLAVVPAGRLSGAQETLDAMRIAWREMARCGHP